TRLMGCGGTNSPGGVTVHAGRRLRLAYIRVYARAEWRVRWRSHLVLAGVTAATVAAAVATMTAAGRSDNAFHRLRAMTHASDAIVLHPDAERRPARAVAAVKAVDGVESAAAEAELFVRPVGTDYFPDYNLYAIAPLVRDEGDGLNTPVVVKGRPVDPGRDDEVALSEDLAAATGVDVGDSITL